MQDQNLIQPADALSCRINAYGVNFEPDLFLADSVFDPKRILYKGAMGASRFEWVGETRPRTKKNLEYFQLVVSISRARTREHQIEKAILFLRHYKSELLRLAAFPGVEMVMLCRPRQKGEIDSPVPNELLQIANESKVSLMI